MSDRQTAEDHRGRSNMRRATERAVEYFSEGMTIIHAIDIAAGDFEIEDIDSLTDRVLSELSDGGADGVEGSE